MADNIDALLQAADQGKAIGRTQQYFRGAPPQPAPKPSEPAKPPARETDDEFIARMLGKGKTSSVSDVGEGVQAGQMMAQAGDLPAGFRPVVLPPTFYEVPAPPAAAPPSKPDDRGIVGGAIMDTLGLTDRPGAVPLTGAPGTKTPLGVVFNPEGVAERATSAAVQIPATFAGGALAQAARVPAALGRIAATGALSGAGQLAQGRSPLGWETLIDTAVAAGTEGLFGALRHAPKGLNALGAPARESLERGLDVVRDRIKTTTKMVIPSIDPAKKLTWDDAIAALRKMANDPQRAAIVKAEIVDWMNRADKQQLGMRAGQIFERITPHFPASTFSELAQAANRAAANPAVRSVADVVPAQEIVPGVSAGMLAGRAAFDVAPRLPIVGPALRAAGRLSGFQ